MSTKIYNGFRFDGTVVGLLYEMKKFREKLEPLAHDLMDPIFENMVEKSKGDIIPPMYAIHDTVDRIKKQSREYLDCSFAVVVFPEADETFGIFFTEKKEFGKLFMENEFIEDFSYWNNTEPEEDISLPDWRARGDKWNKLLGPRLIPTRAGLTFEIIPEDYPNTYYLEWCGKRKNE